MFKRQDPAQLAAQLQSLKGSNSFNESDGKEWKLTQDNAGNGTAVIRFLPGKGEEGLPFVKLVNHGFKIGNKWYIENCTSTHGDYDSCPVCKHISDNDLYNTNNKLYGQVKRKTSFWSNILVVKDPSNPENEGKVFKYRFGQKIMDKINAMVEVNTDLGEVPVDVTCPWAGANFIIKVKKVGGYANYDECKFQGQTAIPKIDEEATQAKLMEDMIDLNAIIAKDQFNDFDKNLETFKRVMGTAAAGGVAAEASKQADAMADELDNFDAQMAEFNADTQSEPAKTETKESKPKEETGGDSLDDLLNDI